MQSDYELLDIAPGASFQDIKKAYRREVLKWHPDRIPVNNEKLKKHASRKFNQITEAYNRLALRHNRQGRFAKDQPHYTNVPRERGADPTGYADETASGLPQFITRNWKNGNKYEGMAVNEQMHGRGLFTYADGSVYSGQFRFGKMEGEGKFTFANGDAYTGQFRQDRFHGQGKLQFACGDRYMGGFAEDQYHGHGVLIAEGRVYSGEWEYGSLKAGRGNY
jgi:hypothetical protein